MEIPLALAAEVGALLKARKQSISLAESASGGLMSAALLSVPGASAYFLGGAAIYTRRARRVFMDMPDKLPEGMVSATEPYALLLARTAQARLTADWGLAETGAAGPTGNSKGDPAGHACIAVVGPGALAYGHQLVDDGTGIAAARHHRGERQQRSVHGGDFAADEGNDVFGFACGLVHGCSLVLDGLR